MARFNIPAGAITDVADLKVGDIVWHVYGIWPPQFGGNYTITLPATKFSHHPEYSDIHASSADNIVFDAKLKEADRPWMQFASDGNLLPGHSHNDNYWFRTEAEAEAARMFLHSEWEKRPDEIARAVEERRELFADDYYDDYYHEPAE